jgi:hypothetical protein
MRSCFTGTGDSHEYATSCSVNLERRSLLSEMFTWYGFVPAWRASCPPAATRLTKRRARFAQIFRDNTGRRSAPDIHCLIMLCLGVWSVSFRQPQSQFQLRAHRWADAPVLAYVQYGRAGHAPCDTITLMGRR